MDPDLHPRWCPAESFLGPPFRPPGTGPGPPDPRWTGHCCCCPSCDVKAGARARSNRRGGTFLRSQFDTNRLRVPSSLTAGFPATSAFEGVGEFSRRVEKHEPPLWTNPRVKKEHFYNCSSLTNCSAIPRRWTRARASRRKHTSSAFRPRAQSNFNPQLFYLLTLKQFNQQTCCANLLKKQTACLFFRLNKSFIRREFN